MKNDIKICINYNNCFFEKKLNKYPLFLNYLLLKTIAAITPGTHPTQVNNVVSNIAPQPLFLDDCPTVQYEHIGDVKYLSAYTEFINGNYTQIGYIALPSFISQQELTEHLHSYMLQTFPLYIILLLIAIVVVWAV